MGKKKRGKTPGTDRLVGRNPVREALEQGHPTVEKLFLQREGGRALQHLHRLAREAGVPVQHVPAERLRRMAGSIPHQGVVAQVTPIRYLELEELLERVARGPDEVRSRKPLLVMLDEIQDPHNFGAIIRSALAAGAEGIIVPERNMAPLSAAAIKASAGAALRLPIARVRNLAEAIDQLKERGYWVIGTAGEGEQSVWEMDWDRPLVIVIGSEGKGIRPLVRKKCDALVRIPLRGPLESLNASVAAGIVLFAAVREREEYHA